MRCQRQSKRAGFEAAAHSAARQGPGIAMPQQWGTLVLDAGDLLGHLLLGLEVALAGDHDALGLGRARAVHGLCPVANGGRAQAQVLDEPQDPLTVLCAHKNLLQISPMVSPFRPTTVSEWKSFWDGIVTTRPPAMSSARRTIS